MNGVCSGDGIEVGKCCGLWWLFHKGLFTICGFEWSGGLGLNHSRRISVDVMGE